MTVFACQMIGQPWPRLFGIYTTRKKAEKALQEQSDGGRWKIEERSDGRWALVMEQWGWGDDE